MKRRHTGFGEMVGGDEFLRRMFEPMPAGWERLFQVGQRVQLIRQDKFGFAPAGADGIIQRIDRGEDTEAAKGRPLHVNFDLRPFHIPFSPDMADAIQRYMPGEPIPEYHTEIQFNVSPNDVRIISGPATDLTLTAAETGMVEQGTHISVLSLCAFIQERLNVSRYILTFPTLIQVFDGNFVIMPGVIFFGLSGKGYRLQFGGPDIDILRMEMPRILPVSALESFMAPLVALLGVRDHD